jgi:hypothetical protein
MPVTISHVDFIPLERDTPTGFEVTAGQDTLGVWEPHA